MASFEWPPTGGTGGVTSLNSETGAINLVAGSNITITPAGQNITISSADSAVAIGGAVTDGTDNSILFVHPDGILAQDNAGLSYDTVTKILTQTGTIGSIVTNDPTTTIPNSLHGAVLNVKSTDDNTSALVVTSNSGSQVGYPFQLLDIFGNTSMAISQNGTIYSDTLSAFTSSDTINLASGQLVKSGSVVMFDWESGLINLTSGNTGIDLSGAHVLFPGDLQVDGQLIINNISADDVFTNTLEVGGTATLEADVNLTGSFVSDVLMHNNLHVEGDTLMDGTLTVGGLATLSGGVTVTGSVLATFFGSSGDAGQTQMGFSGSEIDWYVATDQRMKLDANGNLYLQSSLTPDRVVITNGSSALASSSTTATQVGYLGTTTSDVQTQINGKQATVSFAAVGSTPSANGGGISSGVITLQPADATHPGLLTIGTQTIAGAKTLTSALSMNSNKITSVTDPTSAQDAATKNYVDNALAAFQPKESAYAASTANIAGTYVNGAAGVGATFTVTATGAFSIDGVSPPNGSRILLKDQSSGFQNGVYDLTVTGSLGVSPILTRSLDYNTASDINAGDLIPVVNGTANAITSWLQTATVTTVGTDALVFTQYSKSPSSYASSTLTSAHILVGNGSNVATDVAVTGDIAITNAGVTSYSGTVGTAKGGTNITSYTTGDTLYASATNVLSKLAIGSSGKVLTVAGGVPTWATSSAATYITARYKTAAADTYSNGAITIVNFATVDFDSNSAVTTGAAWHLTAPTTGKYQVNVSILLANSSNTGVQVKVYVNGSLYTTLSRTVSASSNQVTMTGSDIVAMSATDTLDIRLDNGSGGTITLNGTSAENHVSIAYIGT